MKNLLFALTILVSGCTAQRPIASYPAKDPTSVKVADAITSDMVYLGPVSGVSCQSGRLPIPPNPNEALTNAKRSAASMGATHVASVDYVITGVFVGCGLLPGIRAKATAYRLSPS